MGDRDRQAKPWRALGRIAFAGPVLLLCAGPAGAGRIATTPELRRTATAACKGDALRLCRRVLFDEERIYGCMKARHAELSPNCRKVFDAGAATVR